MTKAPVTAKRWTRVEYERLVDAGVFRPGEPIELIGGQLMVSEPQGSAHFTAVGLVEDALREAFGLRWVVRTQGPVALDDDSEPEPDVAVVPGTRRDYRDAHPARPVLVVEVAESSLMTDREQKGSLYARAGVADYWIVNLGDRTVEVRRGPVPDPSAAFGWIYRSVEAFGPGARIAPLAAPEVQIPITDLLP